MSCEQIGVLELRCGRFHIQSYGLERSMDGLYM